MKTLTELLPAAGSVPGATIRWTPGTLPGCGVLEVQGQRDATRYTLNEIPTRWEGRAFRLYKLDRGTDPGEPEYHVFVGADRGNLCGCKGFSRWHHCRHVNSVLALIQNGWL